MSKTNLVAVLAKLIKEGPETAKADLHKYFVESCVTINESLNESDNSFDEAREYLNDNYDWEVYKGYIEDFLSEDGPVNLEELVTNTEEYVQDTVGDDFNLDQADIGDLANELLQDFIPHDLETNGYEVIGDVSEAADDSDDVETVEVDTVEDPENLENTDDSEEDDVDSDNDLDDNGDLGEEDLEDKVEDLETQLADLQAQFLALTGQGPIDAETVEIDSDENDDELEPNEDGEESPISGEDEITFEEDEDFADLEEAYQLEKVKDPNLNGKKEIGSDGKTITTNEISPTLQKKVGDRIGGEPVEVISDEHKGYDRETSPATKEVMVGRNQKKKATQDQKGVDKAGDKSALINKGDGFGSENTKSPVISTKSLQK